MDEKDIQEELKKLLLKDKTSDKYGIFGVVLSEDSLAIIGVGKTNRNQRAHIILSLKKLADTMEKSLFIDFNDGEISL